MADPRTRRMRLWSSALVVGTAVLAVLLVPPVVQLDEQAVDLGRKLLPPSWEHPFGTDDVGRDLLLRCVYGLRVSLLVGLVAALVATVIGTGVGAAPGGRRRAAPPLGMGEGCAGKTR
ncbi:hypothetical protein ACFRFD_33030, partial [Streptomyces sp. NPDC056632]